MISAYSELNLEKLPAAIRANMLTFSHVFRD